MSLQEYLNHETKRLKNSRNKINENLLEYNNRNKNTSKNNNRLADAIISERNLELEDLEILNDKEDKNLNINFNRQNLKIKASKNIILNFSFNRFKNKLRLYE
jgi:hypothetical protein